MIYTELKSIINLLGIKYSEISKDAKYWLIRTYGGKYYNNFLNEKFVGLGWYWEKDLCEKLKISPSSPEYTHIIKNYKKNNYYQRIINTFVQEIKAGDFIISPAYRASKVLFGKVNGDIIFTDEFPYVRKRAVQWIKEVEWEELPRTVLKFLSTQNSLCSANNISNEIERLIYDFYFKENQAYITLQVQRKEAISLKSINEFLTNITRDIIQDNQIFFKTELSSPGFLQFFGSPKGIILIATLLHFLVGGKIELNPKTLAISNETKGVILTLLEYKNNQELIKSINELKINLEPFKTSISSNDIDINTLINKVSLDMEMKIDKNIEEK